MRVGIRCESVLTHKKNGIWISHVNIARLRYKNISQYEKAMVRTLLTTSPLVHGKCLKIEKPHLDADK